jgi:acetyl-CoA synthetase
MTDVIHKDAAELQPPPNLSDYAATRASFDWAQAREQLAGLPGGRGINIAYEALDAHVAAGAGERVALRWLDSAGARHDFSYARLAELTNRFANVLDALGVQRGEHVFALADRVPELYVAALGTLKHGSVFCPLFSVFGPEPIHARMSIGDARVLVTTPRLYRRKVAGLRERLTGLRHVLLIPDGSAEVSDAGCADLGALLEAASDRYDIAPTQPEDMALLHFTSGTTGKPKGAIHVHDAVAMHRMTARYALDLSAGDVFWCTADPGWVTGTSYGIIAPLTVGATLLVDQQEFDAQRWYRTLQDERVDVWYTAPTAIRMLMKHGDELPRQYDLSCVRFIASVGEPLHAEGVMWGQRVFGLPIHDNYWQTETGGIVVANFRAMDVKPGSMGRPLPGIEAAIVARRADGGVDLVGAVDRDGELALRAGWPSMFRGYLHEDERYRRCFANGWYLTGDLARCDSDGYFWFVGRADDVIKSAGHLIGPFEVEAVLLEYPAVAEAGVIGKPDPVAGEVVKAFVALKPGNAADEALQRALLAHARKRLGPAVAPREIAYVESLPKTRSGKIMRRLLKARELGLPEGDTSTLEAGSS